MEFLVVIPARGGSKGVPRKNIKLLASKPLLYYTIDAALKSSYVNRVVVSTEDSEIADIALSCGAEVVVRPDELAGDEVMSAPVVVDTVLQLRKNGYFPDVVIVLQATCPFRDVKKLDKTIQLFLANPDSDSAFTVKKIGLTHGLWRKNSREVKALYDYRNRPRRQDVDRHYDLLKETGETYIIKTDVLLKLNDVIGENPIVDIVDEYLDIDTMEDFRKAEELMLCKEKY